MGRNQFRNTVPLPYIMLRKIFKMAYHMGFLARILEINYIKTCPP
jgi:hypothetical protein